MSRAQTLAAEAERASIELADHVAGLSQAEWRKRAVNNPEVTLGERDEERTVGQVAAHVADFQDPILERVQEVAAARPPAPIALEEVDRLNAARAAANPDPDQAQTGARIRAGGARAAQVIGALTDQELDRSTVTPIGPMTAEQMVRRIFVGHITMHLGSVRAAVGR